MPRQLPPRASLEQLKKQAKGLLKHLQSADTVALHRISESHPRWKHLSAEQLAASQFTLADAQCAIANEHGFPSWSRLQSHVKMLEAAGTTAEMVASLRNAAGKGDLAGLNALLDAHPELIDERGGEGVRTALHQAVFGNRESAVKLLLERGANPNIRCEGDNAYPLHFAVEKNRATIIRLLVEHGADTVGEGDYHELGVIGWASAWPDIPADPQTVAYLLEHGARHNIFSAVAMGDVDAVRSLIATRPGDLELRMHGTKMKSMPLHLAVIKRQPQVVLTLLELGANIESLDEAGFTPLDRAAIIGASEMVTILTAAGARLRLPAAAALGRDAEVARLLRLDPNALKPGCRWGNLIVRASEHGSGEMVETLLRNGAVVNVRDNPQTAIDSTAGYTPLHAAAWNGNLRVIPVLMRHGADVRAREEKYHGTPAGWADYAGQIEARNMILQGHIDIIESIQYDLADRIAPILDEDPACLNRTFRDYGLFPWDAQPWHTPLAYAVSRGREQIARLLIERGADVTVRSPEGETLNEIARKAGHGEIARILRAPEAANP
ncbi:ankyrin repeat domain-containing protein [Occallatibacter riparius]|uniref:Ankyrin repeat domain-containing protein n=1 Tax=Occallatibacter riparius TaxID=1002689 RepID=A0A9J7BIF8_9BACT|nr:ankyrin repeat domain-containing protein [Occallatibacter riparius]UWZ82487.1 ankyrin repeat domain-containing protein [Occallatibacter riparius]